MVAALGAVLPTYIWYLYATETTGPLCEAGTGCDLLRESRHAWIAGVPLPALGALVYLSIAMLAVAPLRWRRMPLVVMAAGGAGLAVYLIAVETLVLKTVSLYGVITAFLALALVALIASRASVRRGGRRLLVIGLVTAAAVAALATVLPRGGV